MEKKLVFCSDCRWLVYDSCDSVLEATDYDCRYPSNVTIKNSWLCSQEQHIKKPSEINQENNCEWFATKHKNAANLNWGVYYSEKV